MYMVYIGLKGYLNFSLGCYNYVYLNVNHCYATCKLVMTYVTNGYYKINCFIICVLTGF